MSQALRFRNSGRPFSSRPGSSGSRRYKGFAPECNLKGAERLLWRVDDPAAARPYLQAAANGGISNASIDLAVIELFRRGIPLQ